MLNYGECRVVVTTQWYEYGRPKSGVDFTFIVSSDLMMYESGEVIRLFEMLLEEMSGEESRYEYLSYEVQFSEPKDLTSEMSDLLERESWWRKTQLEEFHEEGDE